MNKRLKNTENGVYQSIEDKLPLTITGISAQKKNNERFSLFHEGQFLTGVSAKTLTDFSIHKGVELTPLLFEEITRSEDLNAVKECCLRYLSRRDHASSELKLKLQKKGFDEPAINSVIEELSGKGYLNDEQFAVSFANEKAELNKWGPKKITAALYKKGIKKQVIERAVKKATENLQQEQICVDLALKKKHHFLREADPYKRKQKIYNYLAGRGFSNSEIKKSLPKITTLFDA